MRWEALYHAGRMSHPKTAKRRIRVTLRRMESNSDEFGLKGVEFELFCAELGMFCAESALWSAYVLVRRQREIAADGDVHSARHKTTLVKLHAPDEEQACLSGPQGSQPTI